MRFKRGTTRQSLLRFRAVSSTLLLLIGVIAGQIRAAQSEGSRQDVVPRILEILDVGYKLPIEIVAVRNLKTKHWMRDLEIEIRNVSAKPIYEVYIALLLPDDKNGAGIPLGSMLEYGRIELIHPDYRPMAGDQPIRPGETVLLKVNQRISRGYEYRVQNENIPDEASYRVRMIVQNINFGDGTGFINGGVPYHGNDRAVAKYTRYARVPLISE